MLQRDGHFVEVLIITPSLSSSSSLGLPLLHLLPNFKQMRATFIHFWFWLWCYKKPGVKPSLYFWNRWYDCWKAGPEDKLGQRKLRHHVINSMGSTRAAAQVLIEPVYQQTKSLGNSLLNRNLLLWIPLMQALCSCFHAKLWAVCWCIGTVAPQQEGFGSNVGPLVRTSSGYSDFLPQFKDMQDNWQLIDVNVCLALH